MYLILCFPTYPFPRRQSILNLLNFFPSVYLSAIETLICGREMSLIGSTSFGFAQNTIHDFHNTLLNS